MKPYEESGTSHAEVATATVARAGGREIAIERVLIGNVVANTVHAMRIDQIENLESIPRLKLGNVRNQRNARSNRRGNPLHRPALRVLVPKWPPRLRKPAKPVRVQSELEEAVADDAVEDEVETKVLKLTAITHLITPEIMRRKTLTRAQLARASIVVATPRDHHLKMRHGQSVHLDRSRHSNIVSGQAGQKPNARLRRLLLNRRIGRIRPHRRTPTRLIRSGPRLHQPAAARGAIQVHVATSEEPGRTDTQPQSVLPRLDSSAGVKPAEHFLQ